MTKKQIEYIQQIDDSRIHFDAFEKCLSIDSRNHPLILKFSLFIPESETDDDWDLSAEGSNIHKNQSFLERCRIEKIIVLDGEYSFNVEDYSDEETRSHFVSTSSAVGKLYSVLNVYYSHYKKIPLYRITEPDDGGYCPSPNYKVFQIEFKEDEFETAIDFYQKVEVSLPKQYFNSIYFLFENTKLFYDNYFNVSSIPILQSNTKARRLGYLKFIIGQFNYSNYYPASYLAKRIEKEARSINGSLEDYKNNFNGDNKGVIKESNTGISAAPYLDLLYKLNIITEINKAYILTKQSKVYHVLNRQILNDDSADRNPFELNLLDKAFFIQKIFLSDGIYSTSILDMLAIAKEGMSVPDMKLLFQRYVLDELERINFCPFVRHELKREANELKKRIQSWKKPEVYLGHIIEPRINWLLDLKLVSNSVDTSGVYKLSEAGYRFIEILTSIYEETELKSLSLNYIFSHYYFDILSYVYQIDSLKATSDEDLITLYTDEAFKLFKTEAPNRIAASQAIEFVSLKAFLEDHRILEASDVKEYLSKQKTNKYSLDWYASENDGSLSKK